MTNKISCLTVAILLSLGTFIIVFFGSVSALYDDHNLSGIVWQADGSEPPAPTNYCIWVNHSGNWYRFPDTGWDYTEIGSNGLSWYSYVLPDRDHGVKWDHWDTYRVQVNGTPWGNNDGNATSNATGSAGDPFPTPYNPAEPANTYNKINYSAGGGYTNEQRWDVRTIALIDLAPTNITADGKRPEDHILGIPILFDTTITIIFNVTNFGITDSGTFQVSLWNCTDTGQNIGATSIDEFPLSSIPGGGDSGELFVNWHSPSSPGDYYVNITVDSQNEVTEYDKVNNIFILHFKIGPELVVTDVRVEGISPTDPIYVSPKEMILIQANSSNIGYSPTSPTFIISLYNVTGPSGPIIPGNQSFNITLSGLDAGQTSSRQSWIWTAPGTVGDHYVNITVDYGNDTWEADENNNDFTIHFNIPLEPTTTIKVYDPNYPSGNVWYINSTTELYFTVGGFFPPYNTSYRIIDETSGSVLMNWSHYPKGTTFTITWGEGTYRIEFNSTDNVSAQEMTKTKSVIVDDSKPVTSIDLDTPKYRETIFDYWNITSATNITLSALEHPLGSSIIGLDNASGMDGIVASGIYYRIQRVSDGLYVRGTTEAIIISATGGVYTADHFTFSSVWSDGLYTIEYYSVDNLGQKEPTNYLAVYLDNTPPDTLLDVDVPKYRIHDATDIWNITSQTMLSLTADDLGSGVDLTRYRVFNTLVDTGFIDYSSAFTISSLWSDGIYTIEYSSTDNLGNERTDQADIYLDNTGPISNIVSDSSIEKYTNRWEITPSTLFTLSADDGLGCGVEYIWFRFDNLDWQRMLWTDYTGAMELTEFFPSLIFEEIPWNHTIWTRGQDYLGNMGMINSLLIYIEGDIEPPLPPVLKVYVDGNDIYLKWTPSPDDDIHHYLIYMSENKTDFDFENVWIDTSKDDDQGIIPLRTTWNHTNAVITAPEYYYSIRGVDERDNTGYTSNIAGKVTLSFEKGYNTFSLPLELFDNITASEMLRNGVFLDETDTVYRYDTESQKWLGHAKFLPSSMDDFDLKMGEGYMIYINEENVQYTFTGATGTAIRYISGVGDDREFGESLTASVNENQVNLTWKSATGAIGYVIYRATTRMGEGSLTDFNIDPIAEVSEDEQYWVDNEAEEDEYYYMVIAKGDLGEESSTYAIGIKTYSLEPGYRSFSLVLEPKDPVTIASFSREMLSSDSDSIYYYDQSSGQWQGHPRFLPQNINNGKVVTGEGYMIFAYIETWKFTLIGV